MERSVTDDEISACNSAVVWLNANATSEEYVFPNQHRTGGIKSIETIEA